MSLATEHKDLTNKDKDLINKIPKLASSTVFITQSLSFNLTYKTAFYPCQGIEHLLYVHVSTENSFLTVSQILATFSVHQLYMMCFCYTILTALNH